MRWACVLSTIFGCGEHSDLIKGSLVMRLEQVETYLELVSRDASTLCRCILA